MIYFNCDYLEGGHPKILERMMETNMEQLTGYSTDHYCDSARAKIRRACGREEADVHFLVGGTQTNLIAIASILKPYQGVLAAHDGHIACHETGAIEATGHKVLPVPCVDGKITGDEVRQYCSAHATDTMREHTVQPGMVYISFPTEIGSLYTKAELTDLSNACRECGIPLYIDGARMGYGLMSPEADITLPELANLCDMFYIGGTKCGALCGEAVVFPHGAPAHFMTMVKQQGALLAKGRLMGLQFDVLFTDDLYTRISRNAIETADRLKEGLAAKGYRFYMESPTNQVFPILENSQLEALEPLAKFGFWEKYDDTHTVMRIATSWATRMEEIEQLIDLM